MNKQLRFFDYEKAFDAYASSIEGMKQGTVKSSHVKIIAKPVLILSIIRLIDEGKIANRFDYDELDKVYKQIFGTYFLKASQGNLTPLCYPFYYLQTDGFWHLSFLPHSETTTSSPSPAWVRRNCQYGYIDEELWILLSYKPYRDRMKQYIVEEKIEKTLRKASSHPSCLQMLRLLLVM